jgi:hypothetical protein
MSRGAVARSVALTLALATWAWSSHTRAQEASKAPSTSTPEAPGARWESFDIFDGKSGIGALGLVAFRVASTVVEGQNGIDREVDAVGAGIGARFHGFVTLDVVTARLEVEGFAGGSGGGLDGLGHVALGLGAATHLAEKDALLFRLGAGARAFGNASFDFETVQAPVLDLAFQHHGDDWFLDVGPSGGLAIATHAGAGASAQRDLGVAGAGGARAWFGLQPVWVGLDYQALIADDVSHLAGGSFCIAPDGISGCLDARFAAIEAFAGADRNAYAIQAGYAGMSIGVGGGYYGDD